MGPIVSLAPTATLPSIDIQAYRFSASALESLLRINSAAALVKSGRPYIPVSLPGQLRVR
jgi:hypothetical protein